MVPHAIEKKELLHVIATALKARGAARAAAQRALPELVNRTGVPRVLMDVLRTGEISEVPYAAHGLLSVRSELVRRQLRKLAFELSGERRLACLKAMTLDELQAHVARQDDGGRGHIIDANCGLALNRPEEFIEMACDGTEVVDVDRVEEIELMRRTYGIGATAFHDVLLQRPLTPRATARIAVALGAVPGLGARDALRRALARTTDLETKRVIRREQLRQGSAALSHRKGSSRDGIAILRPLNESGGGLLEILDHAPHAQLVQTMVNWPLVSKPEFVSMPVGGELETRFKQRFDAARDARITLGQARFLLRSFREANQRIVAPLLSRLDDVAVEEIPPLLPTACLTPAEAHALIVLSSWAEWRPFEAVATPGASDEALIVAQFQRRGGAAALAAGLQRMSLLLQLREDPSAPAVLAEAVWAAKRRISPLTQALARAEVERSA